MNDGRFELDFVREGVSIRFQIYVDLTYLSWAVKLVKDRGSYMGFCIERFLTVYISLGSAYFVHIHLLILVAPSIFL